MSKLLLTYKALGNLISLNWCHLPSRFSPSQLPFLMSTRRGWRRNDFIWTWGFS